MYTGKKNIIGANNSFYFGKCPMIYLLPLADACDGISPQDKNCTQVTRIQNKFENGNIPCLNQVIQHTEKLET